MAFADVLEAIITRLPAPKGDRDKPLKALLVDSWYDAYLGVVVLVRIIDGVLKKGMKIRMMGSGGSYAIERVGVSKPKKVVVDELGPGEIGFFTGAIKEVADTRVGDTITDEKNPTAELHCQTSRKLSRWCLPASSPWMPQSSKTCARPWASCA